MSVFRKLFFSYKTTIVFLAIYAFVLALATGIEKSKGTSVVLHLIYFSPLFIGLQFLLVLNFTGIFFQKELYKIRKPGFLILHIAFIVILSGALVSHIFGKEGTFHLREGETGNQLLITDNKGLEHESLPFSLELVKFTVKRYPGSSSPSSFESHLIVHEDGKTYEKTVAMNAVLDIKGYRFFQASYDEDEKGTILSVNKDRVGTVISYTGYFLLAIGFIGCFLGKYSRFGQLNKQLKGIRISGKQAIVSIVLFFFASASFAQDSIDSPLEFIQSHRIDPKCAEQFGSLPMLSGNGRIEPVNTFASEVLRKLHKSESIYHLNPDQFLLSVMAFPDAWMKIPFIPVSNRELIAYYDLSDKACAYWDVFDENGNYKFGRRLMEIYRKNPAERSRFDKDLLKLDEQVNIFYQLIHFQRLNLFPKENDPAHTWYAPGDDLSGLSETDSLFVSQSLIDCVIEIRKATQTGDWAKPQEIVNQISTYQQNKNNTLEVDRKKINAELLYNRFNLARYCKTAYFLLGGCLLIFSFASFLKPQKKRILPIRLLIAGIILCFLFHLFGIALRGYISGYAPWSNSYETMVYVSWVTVLAGLFFAKRSPVTLALATVFGGIILFVSGLNWMDPQINPLVPVLKSPWLMFHVAIIVAAYGFAGTGCLLGLTNLTLMLFLKSGKDTILSLRIRELSIINEMAILIGLALLSVGTFLGAIWANESWGRYWGWDPKETWALITMIVYAITVHLRLVKRWNNAWLFNLASVLSFFSVLMTFLGVNYFLTGMHSYGQSDSTNHIILYPGIAFVCVCLLAVGSYRKYFGKDILDIHENKSKNNYS
ncbi:MAG: cytochrome c biogenesis protein CcsA [Candidatus Azobacteroides sp.]|nr:cytochrome c biogenesis protein CcsA [Candidatus Azobacteroides sp.]